MEFRVWLSNQLKEKNLSMRELARLSHITHSSVSDVLSGKRSPTYDFCTAIAPALGFEPSEMVSIAGLLPKPPDWTPEREEWNALFVQLSEENRAEMLQIGRLKVGRQHGKHAKSKV